MKTDNELIAEFMGYSFCKTEHDTFWNTEDRNASPEDWQFHSDHLRYNDSWDWLMPVVEKIVRLDEHHMDVGSLPIGTPINEVYESVVKFIKWYNMTKVIIAYNRGLK